MASRLVLAAALVAGCGGKQPFVGPQLEAVSRVVDARIKVVPIELAGGARAYLIEDERSPLVHVDARYLVGADADPVFGVAHFAEHLSYSLRGSPADPSLTERLDRASVNYNAYTTWEATHFLASGPPESLAELVAVEATRLSGQCAAIPSERIAVERDVVRNELRSRENVVLERLRAALYPSDQRRSVRLGGLERDVEAIDGATVCAFMERHYVPENLVVVVSGPVEVEEARRALSVLGGEPSATPPPRPARARPRLGREDVTLEVPIDEPALVLVFPEATEKGPAGVAARLNAQAMAAYLTELEDTHDFIDAVHVGQIEGGSSPLYLFLIGVSDTSDLEKARTAFFKRRNGYLRDVARDDQRFDSTVLLLDHALQQRRRTLLRTIESPGGRARVFLDHLQLSNHTYGITPELRTLSGLTKHDIVETAKAVFSPSTALSVRLVPGGDADRRVPSLGALSRTLDLDPDRLAADGAAASRPLTSIAIPEPAIHESRLNNGVRVLVAPGGVLPLLDVRAVIAHPGAPIGSARAAAVLARPDFDREFSSREQVADLWSALKMSGSLRPSVSTGATHFRLAGLSPFRDASLWRLGYLLETAVYEADDIARYKRRRSRGADDRRRWASIWAEVFGPKHPWARPEAGSLGRDGLAAFKRRYYSAPATSVVVSGALDKAAVEAQTARVFGRLPKRGAATAPPVVAPPPRSTATVMTWARDDRSQIEVVLIIPVADTPSHYPRRRVIASMLEQALAPIRRELGASYGFSVELDAAPGASHYWIRGELAVERAPVAIERLLAAIAAVGTDTSERRSQFVRARRSLVTELVTAMGQTTSVAEQLEYCAERDLPVDFWSQTARRAAALTIDAVIGESASELALDRAVVVLAGKPRVIGKLARLFGDARVKAVRPSR